MVSISLLLVTSLKSQVTLIPLFQGSEYLVLDNIFSVNIVNPTSTRLEGFLEINIEDRNTGELVLKVNSPLVSLEPGITNSEQINWGNSIDLGTSQLLNSIGSSNKFANGNYLFCYNFISKGRNQFLGVNCYEKPLKIAGVPSLLSPYNKEVIDIRNPVLTWRPPLPSFNTNIDYTMRLAPLHKKQSKIEAISKNFSQVFLQQINRTFQIYPADAIPLESGEKYVWQIIAFQNGFEIGATEIWEFQYQEPLNKSPIPIEESFRFVKTRQDASYYVANKKLYIAFDNKHNQEKLDYEILADDNSNLSNENLPVVELENGVNKIVLDGDLLGNLQHENRYTLTIKTKNKRKYFYNFVYLNE